MKRLSPKSLVALAFLIYFASYFTRYNYSVVVSGIIEAEKVSESAASLAVSFSFISYGVGQLISGIIGDRVRPHLLILLGLAGSSAINGAISFGPGIPVMCALWTVNGFCQSLIWPPLVRILAENLTREQYNRACVTVNAAGSIGTVLLYLESPLVIKYSGWRTVFAISAAVGITIAALFFFASKKYSLTASASAVPVKKNDSATAEVTDSSIRSIAFSSGLIFICIGILLQGIIRDGVTSWTPEFLKATHNLPTESAIFTGVAVPLFSIVSLKVTSLINEKLVKNELTLSVILFILASVSTVLATTVPVMVLSVVFVCLATGCAHGINLLLVCQIPGRFAKYGKASSISGVMNFFTYIGSAVSTFGLALIAEKFGWSTALFVCAGVCVLGLTVCLLAWKKWKSFAAKED